MIMICNNCGAAFDEDDMVHTQECVGECWGQAAYQSVAGSPCCGEYDFRPATCRECALAEPYKPDKYEDVFVCPWRDGEIDGIDTACSCFEEKEE